MIMYINEQLDEDHDIDNSEVQLHRLLHPEHCTLSAYIAAHTHGYEVNTGYLGEGKYVSPLHIPALVVGHRHSRVAVCDTGTTKLPLAVITSYMVNIATRSLPISVLNLTISSSSIPTKCVSEILVGNQNRAGAHVCAEMKKDKMK
jgi:hypothetical protein